MSSADPSQTQNPSPIIASDRQAHLVATCLRVVQEITRREISEEAQKVLWNALCDETGRPRSGLPIQGTSFTPVGPRLEIYHPVEGVEPPPREVIGIYKGDQKD